MRRINILLVTILSLFSFSVEAQEKFYTKTGKISFFSVAPLENIEATHKSAVALLDTKTGDMQFAVLMKGFEFKKALMQEHFNNSYIESDKYPKGEFKGQLVNSGSVDYSNDGIYNVKVKGQLTIHGVTKDAEATGTLTVKEGKIIAYSVFNILLADYNITIPKMYQDNISKTVKITVNCTLDPLK
ncbi:MAG TPA: YceI family protein [Chitinophagaceae bacterium]